jgi:pyruvate,water dikinase
MIGNGRQAMSRHEIVQLAKVTSENQTWFGGKAAHLGTLARAGLAVPPGFCLSSEAFQRFVHHTGLLPRIRALIDAASREEDELESLSALRELLKAAPHVPAFASSVVAAYEAMTPRSPIVAVRSSARSEDSSDASYAGQYDSLLNIQGHEAVLHAIREGWAGYFSDRAFRYRHERGQDQFNFNMGLIVQQMIDPDVSGVLFTMNPLTGSRREILIEAGLGLGEAYVSDQLCPDTFYLTRPRGRLSRRRVQVQRSRIADKPQMLKSVPPGTGRLSLVDVPPERRDRPALEDQQAEALGELGLKIEHLFGAPQDIEWAIDARGQIFVLQARPVTTRTAPRYQRRPGVLWSQRFSGERWTEPATTLGWSIIQPILHHFIYFEDIADKYLQGTLPTRVINGYPYFNITLFRHLVWKVPGFDPPQFILEFFPQEEQEEITAAPYIVPNLELVGTILAQVWRERRWRRYHWNFLTNHRAWDQFLPGFVRAIDAMPEYAADETEARAAVRTGQQLIQEYVKIHLLSLLFANLYYQILSGLLRRWVGSDSDRLLSDLVAAPGENKTIETNRAVAGLAGIARSLPAVAGRLLSSGEPPGRLELQELPGGPVFLEALDELLLRYGHRSSASWEVFNPRWADDPGLVLQFVRSGLQAGHRDLEQAELERIRARQQAEGRIREQLGLRHPVRRLVFGHVLKSTQRYMMLRENQRFYFDKLLLKIKRALESLGRQWTQDGRLADPAELTLLTLAEVDDILAGRLSGARLRALIDTRQRMYARDQEASHPVFLEGDQELSQAQVAGRTLSGLGVSPGRITGTVRVIHRLKEMSKLRKGDILVTRATDPGWTFLFTTAGGLITELGSLLSHGAVIARESNLPAVVNIADATSLLKDGQEITLDGSRGLVYLH